MRTECRRRQNNSACQACQGSIGGSLQCAAQEAGQRESESLAMQISFLSPGATCGLSVNKKSHVLARYSPSSQPKCAVINQSIGTFSNQLDGRTKHQHTVTQCLPNQWIGNVNCSQHGRACLHALARWSGFLQSRVFDRSPPRRGAWKVSERSSRNNIIPHLLVVILALSCCSSNLLPPSLPLAAPHPNRQAPTHHIVGIPNHSSPKGTAIRQDLPVDSLAQSHLSSLHALFLLLSTTQSANWFNRQNEHYRPPHQESLRETHHDSRLCSQHCCWLSRRLSHRFGVVHLALLARLRG